ncbi:hypothetical protein HK099_006651 [Clydaea vesicula]|uniref:Aminomethyltransferase n=1 Tax=Clydaea vesicula TaxID=447962 RepID=A0AAD5U8Z7_9FUNG|nr:hypothetical protein HK099_006651 [Clydaea vesicula]
MVEFAGWSMPVQYSNLGVLASHMWTRENSSIFDVSHMLQTRWEGKDVTKFLETLVVADLKSLPLGSSTLSLFTNENGGIIDDTVINKQDEKGYYVVSNAGCSEKDLKHIHSQLESFQNKGGDCQVKTLDLSLIALQGPKSCHVIEKLTNKSFKDFSFMTSRRMEINGVEVYITRCGYTGEDGFEISVSHDDVVKLTEVLLNEPEVELAGLGARDSLRLEAGLCLYGHDLNEEISPVEGGLTWTIGKNRRVEGGFLGADKILPQIKPGGLKRRIGLIVEGAPARENAEVFDLDGNSIGFHKQGTDLKVKVRNKLQDAKVTKMPFVPHQYYRG